LGNIAACNHFLWQRAAALGGVGYVHNFKPKLNAKDCEILNHYYIGICTDLQGLRNLEGLKFNFMPSDLNIRRIKKTFVKQHSQFYCGLACLASLVKFYGSGTTLNGTSLLGLYQAAQKLSFEVTGYEADIQNLKELKEPVILHILKDEKLEHFVV
jgi:hypothetical protein